MIERDDPERTADALGAFETAARGSRTVRDALALSRQAARRREQGVFIAEGIHLAQEALRSEHPVRLALVSRKLLRHDEGRSVAASLIGKPFPVRRVEDATLQTLASAESHQGILLVVERRRSSISDFLSGCRPAIVLVACGIQDPGNLGALARITEAAWGSGLACAGGADPFSTRCVRAGAGSVFRLPLVEFPDITSAAASLRGLGFRLIGASPQARQSYREERFDQDVAVFVGGEGAGLPSTARSILDAEVRIPIRAGVESLNVASAASVILFEAASRSRVD